jgi:hypothetical protein
MTGKLLTFPLEPTQNAPHYECLHFTHLKISYRRIVEKMYFGFIVEFQQALLRGLNEGGRDESHI